MLPIAWADYFGRAHFGAIRGIALSAQVLAQAAGPLVSGVLRDLTGNYVLALQCFAVLAGLGIVAALAVVILADSVAKWYGFVIQKKPFTTSEVPADGGIKIPAGPCC